MDIKKFENFISLGYFCGIAQELERTGLRSTSSPFDWNITSFKGVIEAIENHFEDYFKYEYLAQNEKSRGQYRNEKYGVSFFHDFDEFTSLAEQLPAVVEKYERRINRFYEMIKEPTLFIRYISSQGLDENGKSKELDFIENNLDRINGLFKSFNPDNDIIYIANDGVISDKIHIYNVPAGEGDVVCRWPTDHNAELEYLLVGFEYDKRLENAAVFQRKIELQGSEEYKQLKKQLDMLKAALPVYKHDKVY